MFALALTVLSGVADPVAVVQLQYPAQRTTVTTASGCMVYYTLERDAPTELRRAYKMLELAEREVLIAEALQLFRAEMVANERRLEGLRTARMASYLNQTSDPTKVFTQEFSGQLLLHVDPTLTMLVPESSMKWELGRELAREAKIERAIAAVDRLSDAHYQLRQVVVSLAYPDAATRPVVKQPGKIEATRGGVPVPVSAPTAPAAKPAARPRVVTPEARGVSPQPSLLEAAERAEKAAAEAEVRAEARERKTRAAARAAEQAYQLADGTDRGDARFYWVSVRDEWEEARREWDAARTKWQAARDAVEAARKVAVAPPKPVVPTGTAARPQ
jgi:hypothetical protein